MTTIDLTPSWVATVQSCLLVLSAGNDEGKAIAKRELLRMGQILDDQVKRSKP